MTDNEILGSLIAVTATVFGLVTGIQALARAKATNEMEHKMVLQKLDVSFSTTLRYSITWMTF